MVVTALLLTYGDRSDGITLGGRVLIFIGAVLVFQFALALSYLRRLVSAMERSGR